MALNKIKKLGTLNPNTADSSEIVARAKHVNPIIDVVNGMTDGTGATSALTASIGTATITTETVTTSNITTANITTLNSTTINRTGQRIIMSVAGARVGATAGWVVTGSTNLGQAAIPASQTSSTLVVPVTVCLRAGETITGFSVHGGITSGGGTVTLDCDLRKLTATNSATLTDASVGAITQVSKTAAYLVAESKGSLTEVATAGVTYYFLLTATTGSGCSISINGFTITITQV